MYTSIHVLKIGSEQESFSQINTDRSNKILFNNGNSCLKCIYTNTTSLVNKWDEFNSLVPANHFPYIIMVTET
ncbi:hypothetical protein BpHYR1_023767 [Brachionus plicatilis]|uniref:Uncharacterized protein n=1 Tax=Brachionus plicatilis TaxID=10195 RepID=A0A3M7SMU6_BRAPC|nr:hypothetical protein BpHYR1_023767 [Brachionus plicatilis]